MTGMREAVVDAGAIADNVAALKRHAGTPELIAVVKADGYGHGAATAARAAIAGGATRLGVADLGEALALRRAIGAGTPILAWLHAPGESFAGAAAEGVEVGVSSIEQLDAVAAAGGRPRVHLKLETGLARNGAAPAAWPALVERAARLEREGALEVVGLFSHLAGASRDSDLAQVDAFAEGIALAGRAGLHPPLLHLAATAATLVLPEARFTAVRVGIGVYGLPPVAPPAGVRLRPAMTLRAPVVAVRRVPAGTGVSYDHAYRTAFETTLALVPLGYADGVPRQASDAGPVAIGGRRYRVAGRIAMDQLVVDVGDDRVRIGDTAVIFGDPDAGAPSADEWAAAAGTIAYDIVTGVGARVARVAAP